ncbi:alpha/beta fold hydrolase [Phenylobacterium deserti]|uniref:Alpha/beta hydrolase n=1 Tax=Phenylobacterium deserti TaxID=1914756 RepID=A0A328ATZ1_9CAUL|nr:alpha/beta hydrolase [Phenylobacterium deserti]RAK56984.1 alpha/beta hydrolase [Phenylobacterium deserti]
MAEQAQAERVRKDPPPEHVAPLAALKGAEPPAPRWFRDAIAVEPERSFVENLGASLEVLTWGEVGKPGLLFIHGASAHADWWSFIAPFFAQDYRIAAVSLAGMGLSDWRETYRFPDFASDFEAVAQATGLYADGGKPIYIGHSFGGAQVFFTGMRAPEQLKAGILIDTGFGAPPEQVERGEAASREAPDREAKTYPSFEAALARFRLMPLQPTENLYVADFIARRSLRQVERADGSEGWTWRFDPRLWAKLDRTTMRPTPEDFARPLPPMAHIAGEHSALLQRRRDGKLMAFPTSLPEIVLPDAYHHVMVDQPLALVSALRTLLTAWPATAA